MSRNNGDLEGLPVNPEYDFDSLEPRFIDGIRIGGKTYKLKEAGTDAAVKFRNAVMRSYRMSGEGNLAGVDGLADVEPLLVSLCIVEVKVIKGERREYPVPLNVVRSWLPRVTKKLFNEAKAMSDLSEKPTTVEEVDQQIAALQSQRDKLALAESAEENGGETETEPEESPAKKQ